MFQIFANLKGTSVMNFGINPQHDFPKMRGGVNGRLELFRKFIRFGRAKLPLPSLHIFLALRVYFFFSVTDVGENLYKQTSMGAAYVRIHLKLELKGPSALRELTSSFSHSVS